MTKYGMSALALGFVLLSLSMLLQPSAQGAGDWFSSCYPLKLCRGFYSEVGGDKCIFETGEFRACEFAFFSSCADNAGYPCHGVWEGAKKPCSISVKGCN